MSPSPQRSDLPSPAQGGESAIAPITNPDSSALANLASHAANQPANPASTTASANPSATQRRQQRRQRRRREALEQSTHWLTKVARLLLLLSGATVATGVGMAIAHYYPATDPDIPVVEVALRRSGAVLKILQAIPQQFTAAVNVTHNSSNANQTQIIVPPEIPSPPPNLSPAEQQQLRTELTKVQVELNQLIGRTNALETRLGGTRPTESLETRLQRLAQQLNASTAIAGNTTNPAPSPTPESAQPSPAATNQPLSITLPSDSLFADTHTALRPSALVILDNIIADLRPYQNRTIRITGHTDNVGSDKENRTLSVQRAEMVRQYLARVLKDRYRWVVLGYGASRPLAPNNSDLNRQRNRRIEITVDR